MAWLALVVVLIALTRVSSSAQQGQARGQMLFEPRGEAVDAAPGQADRTRKRGRRVRVNAGALAQADVPGGADAITLNLFDDVQLRARKHQLEATRSGGLVWRGRLLDVAGEATFAVQDGVVAGTVFAGDKVYEVLYAGDGEHDVREIEPSEFPTDDPNADLPSVEPDPQADAMDAAVAAEMAGDAASQVDVMVIWTPAARTAAGGVSAIQSLVNLAVANTNTGYANSAVTQRARLVYSGELAYSESSPSTDLSRLAMTTDGYLDSVHTLRNTYGADVVTLLGEGYVNAGACGVGYLMTYVSTGFASSAFNVVDRTCAAGNLTYAHEMGHNMGLQHDPANAGSSPAYSYAYGYQEPTGLFRTVMAYACPTGSCPRLMYFANPAVSYSGRPTGTASQNTALALNNTAPTVANFRQAVTGSCTYALGSTSTSVGSGTATSSVSVTAGTGCAWTAASNASWLTIISGASGSGSGTTAFSVAANTAGTSRSGTLTVAGQTFTVSQAAAACAAFSLSPTSQSVTAAGGAVSVTVTGTTGCARTATSNASWITVTAGVTGTGSGTVGLSVAANTAGTARTGTVTAAGQTFTVSQAAACNFALSATTASFPAAASSGTVGVTATSGCTWAASSNVTWITFTSDGSGTGNGTVSYSVSANGTTSPRSGTLTIAGRTLTVTQAGLAPVVVSSLTADKSFPVATKTPITWTAMASGGTGPLEYQFWRYRQSTAAWTMVSGYAASNVYSWTPGNGDADTYSLQVWVRVAGSAASYDAYRATGSFTISGSRPLSVSLARLDLAQPATAGTAMTWSAVADGGVTPQQFKFWLYSAQTGWQVLQEYGSNRVLSWTPQRPGQYAVQVWVRNPGSQANYDAWSSSGYFDVVAGPQRADLWLSRPLPSAVGVPLTLTAVGSGPADPLEYQFWILSDGAWSILRPYDASAVATWTPTTPGAKAVQVWSRRAGSTSMEAWTSSGFFNIGTAPVVITEFTGNQTFPLPGLTPITWTARASGGSAALEFQFWRLSNGTWSIAQPYGSSTSYAWTPQASDTGSHAVQVWVRSVGSSSQYEQWATTGMFDITP